MKTLKEEFLQRAKEADIVDPDPNSNMCKAYAHFDGEGWTKFKLVGLIIELSEKLDKLESHAKLQNEDDFYAQWNEKTN